MCKEAAIIPTISCRDEKKHEHIGRECWSPDLQTELAAQRGVLAT
jgi:hypothetical protein